MKKLVRFLPVVALAGAIFMFGCSKTDSVNQASQNTLKSKAVTGNLAPSGAHYNLNIIGVPKGKTADMTGSNGGVIFVSLGSNGVPASTKIMLTPAPAGESFQVLDANGTDGNGASFQLPIDVSTTYTVWGRALGTPGGKAVITTCATGTVSGTTETVVDLSCENSLDMTRSKNSKFINVSDQLLNVTIGTDITIGGTTYPAGTVFPLFSPLLYGYFWDYDNQGLKLLQLRFYPNV